LHGDDADRVFAAVEYDYRDTAARLSRQYGGYGVVLLGELGWELYVYWECDGGGREFCGLERDG